MKTILISSSITSIILTIIVTIKNGFTLNDIPVYSFFFFIIAVYTAFNYLTIRNISTNKFQSYMVSLIYASIISLFIAGVLYFNDGKIKAKIHFVWYIISLVNSGLTSIVYNYIKDISSKRKQNWDAEFFNEK